MLAENNMSWLPFLTILALLCAPEIAVGLELKRDAVSGKATVMFSYSSWDRNCQSQTGIVKLLTKPTHGTATYTRKTLVAKFNRFNSSDPCLGRSFPMFQVMYASVPGYRGTDTFQVERTLWDGRRDIDTFRIQVR